MRVIPIKAAIPGFANGYRRFSVYIFCRNDLHAGPGGVGEQHIADADGRGDGQAAERVDDGKDLLLRNIGRGLTADGVRAGFLPVTATEVVTMRVGCVTSLAAYSAPRLQVLPVMD